MAIYTRLGPAAVLLGVLISEASFAQETDRNSDGLTDERKYVLDEIIVSAQKRSENMQSVPVAVSAFSAEFLEQENIVTVDDLKFRVPNLVFYQFNVGTTTYSIRGMGSNSRSAAIDGAVGLYLDEVYMGRGFLANTDFLDIERIEVLRGPQGTLYGRNTTGGAISYFSSKPDDQFRYKGQISLGNYDQVHVDAYVSGPLSEKLAGKIAVTTQHHDGYNYNTTTGNDVEDKEFSGIRAGLRYVPDQSLEANLNWDVSRRRSTGDWWFLQTEAYLFGRGYEDPREGPGHTDDGYGKTDNSGGSLKIDWYRDFGTFTSISSFREATMRSRTNSTGIFVAELDAPQEVKDQGGDTLFIQQEDYDSRQYSQELRFTSPDDDRFRWIAGLFYYDEAVEHTRITDWRFHRNNAEGRGRFDATGDTASFAVFGNATFNFTDKFGVQAGIRWTRDDKDHTQIASGDSYGRPYTIAQVPVTGFTAASGDTWEGSTPTVSFNYQATDDAFFYIGAAKGFRSGGFNDTQTEKLDSENGFDGETVISYEMGAKTEWLDNRLRVNLTAFYLSYDDLQVSTTLPATPNSPPIFVTSNAGSTYNRGIELEWDYLITPDWTFYGNYTDQRSKIEDLVDGGRVRDGNELPRVPHTKLFVGTRYTYPINARTYLTGRLSYSHSDEFFNSTSNNPLEVVPAQETLDASLGVDLADGRWSVELWGKNLTDEENLTSLFALGPVVYGHLGTPRTYGVRVLFRND